ncbi:MAG: hypothetical protein KJO42_13430 [Silicimonas sp.]|nr:hypothetical protein [Silicimonas sp.]
MIAIMPLSNAPTVAGQCRHRGDIAPHEIGSEAIQTVAAMNTDGQSLWNDAIHERLLKVSTISRESRKGGPKASRLNGILQQSGGR